jgi:hypothetical protein
LTLDLDLYSGPPGLPHNPSISDSAPNNPQDSADVDQSRWKLLHQIKAADPDFVENIKRRSAAIANHHIKRRRFHEQIEDHELHHRGKLEVLRQMWEETGVEMQVQEQELEKLSKELDIERAKINCRREDEEKEEEVYMMQQIFDLNLSSVVQAVSLLNAPPSLPQNATSEPGEANLWSQPVGNTTQTLWAEADIINLEKPLQPGSDCFLDFINAEALEGIEPMNADRTNIEPTSADHTGMSWGRLSPLSSHWFAQEPSASEKGKGKGVDHEQDWQLLPYSGFWGYDNDIDAGHIHNFHAFGPRGRGWVADEG